MEGNLIMTIKQDAKTHCESTLPKKYILHINLQTEHHTIKSLVS